MRWSEKRNVTGIRRHMIRGAGIHDPVSDSRWSEAHGAEGVGQSLLIPGAGPGRLGRGPGTPAVAAAAGSWKKQGQSAWVESPVAEGCRRDWAPP